METILFVEDTPEIRFIMELSMRPVNVQSIMYDGPFTEEMTTAVDWSTIDVVVTDQLFFADEWDGKKLLDWLAKNHPRIKRVIYTGYDTMQLGQVKADLVLRKPLGPTDFRAAVITQVKVD